MLSTTEDEYISNVLFGDINNSSGWQSLLADFTNLSTTIEAGTSENITVTNGLPYTNDLATAWVDWNKDFDFNAADEQYVLTNQNGTGKTFNGEISVPQNQPTGNYRMRIRMCYFTEPVIFDSCCEQSNHTLAHCGTDDGSGKSKRFDHFECNFRCNWNAERLVRRFHHHQQQRPL